MAKVLNGNYNELGTKEDLVFALRYNSLKTKPALDSREYSLAV
jgi:hypothetical protein